MTLSDVRPAQRRSRRRSATVAAVRATPATAALEPALELLGAYGQSVSVVVAVFGLDRRLGDGEHGWRILDYLTLDPATRRIPVIPLVGGARVLARACTGAAPAARDLCTAEALRPRDAAGHHRSGPGGASARGTAERAAASRGRGGTARPGPTVPARAGGRPLDRGHARGAPSLGDRGRGPAAAGGPDPVAARDRHHPRPGTPGGCRVRGLPTHARDVRAPLPVTGQLTVAHG
jgi:hypothetical protein